MDKARTKHLRVHLAEFPPNYFAMVMATGIVSIASHLLGFETVATFLFRLNVAFYAALWLIYLARLIIFPEHVAEDLGDHNRGVGYFTVVAGTCILGSQLLILRNAFRPAAALLCLAVFLWLFLIYVVFTLLITSSNKPSLEKGINGVWLVSIVSTQAISILSAMIAPHLAAPGRTLLLFFSLWLFLIGSMLYVLIITLIFYRLLFFKLSPGELSHPYWINMGAVAITTLAGTALIWNGRGWPFLTGLHPFVLGLTLLSWATASWWIPLLVLLGAWKFFIRHDPFIYESACWGMVFPLGMYTTCTWWLEKVTGLHFLSVIPKYFIYAALLAWGLTCYGLLSALFKSTRRSKAGEKKEKA